MHKSTIRGAVLAVPTAMLLSACAYVIPPHHYVDVETPAYDPAVSARMRVLSSNGPEKSVTFWEGSCAGSVSDPGAVKANDGFVAAWKYSSRSVVIGMPTSPREGMRVDGLFSKDLIREYVVPAGKPITLLLSMSTYMGQYGGTTYCNAPPVTFSPAAGQDYDVFLDYERQTCRAAIRRIDKDGLDEPVTATSAMKCSIGVQGNSDVAR